MRGLTEINKELASERENRRYLEGRIDTWESRINETTPGTPEHSKIVRRLVSLNLQLTDAETTLRLLRVERDAATTTH